MALRLFANNALSTLASSISATSPSMTVFAGSGALFPVEGPSQYFTLTLMKAINPTIFEIVRVISTNVDTFGILRAQEGTVAQAWNAGDLAYELTTAGSFQDCSQADDTQAQIGNVGIDLGSANAYSVPLNPPLIQHRVGMPIRWIAGHTNTGPSTFLDGFSTSALVQPGGQPLLPGQVTAGTLYTVMWTGSSFQLMNPSPAVGSFTMTYVGTAQFPVPSGTAYYSVVGSACLLTLPVMPGGIVSNTATLGYSGIPAALQPADFSGTANQLFPMPWGINNGVVVPLAYAVIQPNSQLISFGLNGLLNAWQNTGIKGVSGAQITVRLY